MKFNILRLRYFFGFLIFMLIMCLLSFGCTPETAPEEPGDETVDSEVPIDEEMEVLKIGCIMPFTGPYGFYGEIVKPHLDIFVDLINEDGGVVIGDTTYEIEMLYRDDEIDPSIGPVVARDLVDEGVLAIVGSYSTNAPIAEALTPHKVLFLGQANYGIDPAKHTYFIAPNCEIYGGVAQMYAALERWPDIERIGIAVYDWQIAQAEAIIDIVLQEGTPVSDKGITDIPMHIQTMGDMDFTIVLTKMGNENVDLLFNIFGPADYALLCKQAHDMGLDFVYATAGTMTDVVEFIDIAGYDAVQNKASCVWHAPWEITQSEVRPDLLEMAERITARVEEETGLPRHQQYMGHYDWGTNHLQILLDLYQQAGTTDPDVVMEIARGGTITDFHGTWTLSGEETWGAPIVKGTAGLLGVIEGDGYVYGGEYKIELIP